MNSTIGIAIYEPKSAQNINKLNTESIKTIKKKFPSLFYCNRFCIIKKYNLNILHLLYISESLICIRENIYRTRLSMEGLVLLQ